MKRLPEDYICDILESVVDIEKFTEKFDFSRFQNDKKTIFAVIRAIEIIGEAGKNVSEDIKTRYSDIPWKQIAGMRDKLIHGYFGVDLMTVWKTVTKDMPILKKHILEIIEKEGYVRNI